MRVMRLTFAVWYDEHWRAGFRKAWKQRRYWLARPEAKSLHGRALALQFGPVTLKWTAEGRKENG